MFGYILLQELILLSEIQTIYLCHSYYNSLTTRKGGGLKSTITRNTQTEDTQTCKQTRGSAQSASAVRISSPFAPRRRCIFIRQCPPPGQAPTFDAHQYFQFQLDSIKQ